MEASTHCIHDSLIRSAAIHRASSTRQLFVLEARGGGGGSRRHRPGHGTWELKAIGQGPRRTNGQCHSVGREEKAHFRGMGVELLGASGSECTRG